MFYQPELFVYLLALPVFGLIVLPLVWDTTRLLYRLVEQSRLMDVQGFMDMGTIRSAGSAESDRRSLPRVRIKASEAIVARQMKCCRTNLENISSQGICVANVSTRVYESSDRDFRIVLRTRGRNFTMDVRPCWKKRAGNRYILGGEIVRAPTGWNNFVDDFGQPERAFAA